MTRPTGRRRRAPLLLAASFLATAFLAGPALASPSAGGVAFPAGVEVDGTRLVENGAGVRVFFLVIRGYVSALYVPREAHDPADILAETGPKELRTVFLHAASTEQLRGELKRIHDGYCAHVACDAADERDYAALVAHETAVRAGDGETFLVTGGGVTVTRDGDPSFTIPDPSFGTALLGSMLGPSAPTARYRRGLLGLDG